MIQASIITWESGTDLVLDARVSRTPHEVWQHVADPEACAEWFAPFSTPEEDRIVFDFEDDALTAELLVCQEDSHVLLAFEALGQLGLSLTELEDGTRISVTHTFATVEEAAEILAEVGPVWETHLRLLCEVLGEQQTDIREHELYERYDELAAQARDDAAYGAGSDDAGEGSR
jgi:hypothetical protein